MKDEASVESRFSSREVLCEYSSRVQVKMCECIVNNLQIGIVVADPFGRIIFLNKTYAKFVGLNAEEQYGKNVCDVIENTRVHIVAKTGIAELDEIQRIKGKDAIVQRIPIKQNEKVIAVLGIVSFESIDEINKLLKKINVLEKKVKLYEQEIHSLRSVRYTIDSFTGQSKAAVAVKAAVHKAALSDLPVMISGESGTGKEIIAQSIHNKSERKMYSFIRVNCPAIPEELMESELFGYVKGAFTGANSSGKPGKFELAHNGTIFLDEIGDLPLQIQPKLLRILEEKEFERLGGSNYICSNFRLITASNKSLRQMVDEGNFRKDLFYRLRVINIDIPALRERREDIIPIAEHLLEQISIKSKRPRVSLDFTAKKALQDYDWPGNVRELLNMLESTVSSINSDTIYVADLSFETGIEKKSESIANMISLPDILANAEKEAILKALSSTNNNKSAAASLLGMNRTFFYKKLKKHNLE